MASERTGDAFTEALTGLGFRPQTPTRRGGRPWVLAFNSYLTFTVHEYADAAVVSWSVDLGELILDRGWQIGAGETSFQELYPQRDARVARDIDAVGAEITRVLASLRLDLGDPAL